MKKNIYSLLFLLIFIFSFFVSVNSSSAFYEYRNSDGEVTSICGFTDILNCSAKLQEKCGANTTGTCVLSSYDCGYNSYSVEPICPVVQPITSGADAGNKDTYNFLAPIPGLEKAENIDDIGKYFNIIFQIAIGLCGALAVIMIVIGGVQYMGDESIFGKTEAKSRITKAILGLVIALAAYALLNTVNPDLLGGGGLNIKQVTAEITDFAISGGASFDGKPIKINFNKEAYPAAKIASKKTGVETAFILAMFAQETSNGSNTGKCNYLNANMGAGQLASLQTVVTKLNKAYPGLKLTYQTVNMSCSGGGSTNGGAIGYTQFLPGTWLEHSDNAKAALGHEPNPWNAGDALMMTAYFLKSKGGAGSDLAKQENAACKYFGSCNVVVSCGGGVSGTYGQCIMGKKLSIQQQIDESIKKGEIEP